MRPNPDIMHEKAVAFATSVLRHASDWQEAEHALANHTELGPWLETFQYPLAATQRIIRAAEKRVEQTSLNNNN